MQKLRATDDSRITYDEATGAVRSFFGADLVEPPPAGAAAAERNAGEATRAFLDANRDAFKLDEVTLARAGERRGSASTAVTYVQQHDGIPVYRGKVVVGVEQASNRVASVVNHVDYAVPAELTRDAVRIPSEQVAGLVRTHLSQMFGHVKTGTPSLYIYRPEETTPPDTESQSMRAKVERAESLGNGEAGRAYLAWHAPADTTEPSGSWDVFVDARTGELIQVKDRRRYASAKGMVFFPDPITSSGDATLSSSTPAAALSGQRHEVDIENLDAPDGTTFKLNGRWVETRDIESPEFDIPTTTTDFRFDTGDRRFLSVQAYYWLDRLINYVRQFGVETLNNAVDARRIGVAAQG